MSTISGAFTETQLLDQMVRADELLLDDRIKLQFKPKIDVLNAISAVNTATVNPLFGQKDRDVQVMWMNACDIDATTNTDCVFGGNTVSTNTDTYALSYNKAVPFYVTETDFDDNYFDPEEAIAKAFLHADVSMLEAWAAYAVARLNIFKGVNTTDPEGKGDITGTDTYILPAYWNASLMAYFARVAAHNQFTSPTMLSGNNLWEAVFLANANSANANGKGDAILYGGLPWYFDLFGIDSINTPDYVTYMLSMGSIATATKNYNPVMPEVVNGVFTRYQMASKFVPGITYDVFYKPECDEDRVKHNFKLKMKGDIFLNPTGCNETNTGVLSFLCGTSA